MGIKLAQQIHLDAVMDRVELNCESWVMWARGQAKTISLLNGKVSTDDIQELCTRYGMKPDSPNAYGTLFRQKGWQFMEYKQSRIPSNHLRRIMVWRWNGV